MVPQHETGNSVKWLRVHSLILSNISLKNLKIMINDLIYWTSLRGKSRSAGHPSLEHGNASILRTTVVQSLKKYHCCRHHCCNPCGVYFSKLHTQTKKKKNRSGFGLVIFWISTSWDDDLCWQAWSVFPAFLNSPRQSRDISVRFHRFIILLMFVQGYKKKESTD